MKWDAHKFGGTSVANADRYKNIAGLLGLREVIQKGPPTAIVVSAMSKVTDALIELTQLAQAQNSLYQERFVALQARHRETVEQLVQGQRQKDLWARFEADFQNISEVLRGIWHLKMASERSVEMISGMGEVWSAQMLCAHLNELGIAASWLDARQVLVVEPGETGVQVLWPESQAKTDQFVAQLKEKVLVITGFVAATQEGVATTLRRNGSDYSASIFGALLKAEKITIWTDVDGVLSADPRLVPEAVVLEDLSYEEATELAYFGAKVVHPSTMAPAIRAQIPIWIRNTFRPEAPGSVIRAKSVSKLPVKGFSTIEEVALCNLEGTGMVGVPGIAERLFGALRGVGVSVIMISQASSEHSICFAIPLKQAPTAKPAIEKAFAFELGAGIIQKLEIETEASILAAVGDNMAHRAGLAGQLMNALGRAGVSIRAIAQGSSERNISLIIQRKEAVKALRAVHAAFFLSDFTLSIGILGIGGVGSELLRQLKQESSALKHKHHIDFRVRALANSKQMILGERLDSSLVAVTSGADSASPADQAAPPSDSADRAILIKDLNLEQFIEHLQVSHLPHAVLIDCTSSDAVAESYPEILRKGVHIITPNKKAKTKNLEFAATLAQAEEESQKHFLYETNVGAGLPILNTLRELIQTGDEIEQVEGILSGTLSFIFNSFSAQNPFSQVVLEAQKRGYTEPDPREDLSGQDVARKLVILGREMGLAIELKDVEITPLLPREYWQGGVDDFLRLLPQYDSAMLAKLNEAEGRGEVLRFVGRIDKSGLAKVELRAYPKTHAFARLSATDNIVAYTTRRYQQPLIVQGPGAGREVTAAGVFADLLRLSSYLGAHR